MSDSIIVPPISHRSKQSYQNRRNQGSNRRSDTADRNRRPPLSLSSRSSIGVEICRERFSIYLGLEEESRSDAGEEHHWEGKNELIPRACARPSPQNMMQAAQTLGTVMSAGHTVLDNIQNLAASTGLMTQTLDTRCGVVPSSRFTLHPSPSRSIYDPENDPIWRHPGFLDIFAGQCIEEGSERVVVPGEGKGRCRSKQDPKIQ